MGFKKAMSVTLVVLMSVAQVQAAQLDSKSAVVNLQVGKFAKITGLDNFTLLPQSSDGAANSIYSGSDQFQLETNCAVQVNLSGEQLSNGSSSISTSYKLDNGGMSFETGPGVHSAPHSVSASATLGNISSQEAGAYAANITITVAAL